VAPLQNVEFENTLKSGLLRPAGTTSCNHQVEMWRRRIHPCVHS